MAYLDSSEEAALAYAQVSSMVHFLQTRRGLEIFPTMLSRIQQDEDPMYVMADLAGYSSFDEFQEKWKNFLQNLPLLQEQIKALPTALDGEGGDFASDPVLSDRKDLQKFMRLGELLLEANRPKAALVEFRKVTEKSESGVPSPALMYREAQCYKQLDQQAKAIQIAGRGVKLYPSYVELQMLIGELHAIRGYTDKAIEHWKNAHDINPFDIRIQKALVSLYEKNNDMERKLRHEGYLQILATGGASTFSR